MSNAVSSSAHNSGKTLAGPLLIGYLANWGLHGFLCVQVYIYYLAFPKDGLNKKLVVYGVFLIEMTQTLIATRDAFVVFGRGFNDLNSLKGMHLIWLTVPVLSGIVAFVGQLYFAYRIAIISGSRVIGCVVALLSLFSAVSAFVTGGLMFQAKELKYLWHRDFLLACGLWNGSAALCDVTIAVFMTYFLSRNDSSFPSSHFVITRLICVSVETGLVTAGAAIANLIFLIGFRHSPAAAYFAIPALTITKLYSNTLLVILNSRMCIVGGRNNLSTQKISHHATLSLSMHRTLHLNEPRKGGADILLDDVSARYALWSQKGVHSFGRLEDASLYECKSDGGYSNHSRLTIV